MTSPIDVAALIAAAATLIRLIADATGETTEQVTARVLADCATTAADPTDETDAAADAIDADLPDASGR